MNKLHRLLLDDYLKDSTDNRLVLFSGSVNRLFVLNKKNKEGLIQLINDYKLNKIPLRLAAIENYLGAQIVKPAKRMKPSELNKLSPVQTVELREKVVKERTEEEKLRMQLLSIKKQNWATNPNLITRMTEIEDKLAEYRKDEDYDSTPNPEKTWLNNVTGLLGHWNDENSIAYKIVNNSIPRIVINTGMPFEPIMEALEYFSGNKTLRQTWLIQTNKGYGVQTTGFKEQVILTNRNSGLAPMKENGVMTTLTDSGFVEDNQIGGLLNQLGPIAGTGQALTVGWTK